MKNICFLLLTFLLRIDFCNSQLEYRIEMKDIHYPIEEIYEYCFFNDEVEISKLTNLKSELLLTVKIETLDIKVLNDKISKILKLNDENVIPAIDGYRREIEIYKNDVWIKKTIIENVLIDDVEFLIKYCHKIISNAHIPPTQTTNHR